MSVCIVCGKTDLIKADPLGQLKGYKRDYIKLIKQIERKLGMLSVNLIKANELAKKEKLGGGIKMDLARTFRKIQATSKKINEVARLADKFFGVITSIKKITIVDMLEDTTYYSYITKFDIKVALETKRRSHVELVDDLLASFTALYILISKAHYTAVKAGIYPKESNEVFRLQKLLNKELPKQTKDIKVAGTGFFINLLDVIRRGVSAKIGLLTVGGKKRSALDPKQAVRYSKIFGKFDRAVGNFQEASIQGLNDIKSTSILLLRLKNPRSGIKKDFKKLVIAKFKAISNNAQKVLREFSNVKLKKANTTVRNYKTIDKYINDMFKRVKTLEKFLDNLKRKKDIFQSFDIFKQILEMVQDIDDASKAYIRDIKSMPETKGKFSFAIHDDPSLSTSPRMVGEDKAGFGGADYSTLRALGRLPR